MPFLREPSHILLLLIVVTVLFGAKRLPDSARSLGRSMRIFKSEMKEMKNDEPGSKPKNDDAAEK
jgi:TatA/E family protein of Tat protein translocase